MSTPDDKPPLPTFDEEEAPIEEPQTLEHAPQGHVHSQHGEQQYYDDQQQHYDENGQPYSEEEQQYDENGQPYAPEQQYDEHGQPYSEEDYPEHEGQHYSHEAPTQQIDAYPTSPQHFTPPMPLPPSSRGPFSRQPLGLGPPPHSMQGLPMHPGGPYRLPATPEPPTVPAFRPTLLPIPRPFLGSALAIYGVLLWSFVVAGQFATSWITGSPMSNGSAAMIVLVATITAWVFAIRRSRKAVPVASIAQGVSRGIGTLTVAGLLFILTMIVATIVGQTSNRNHDFAIAFFLVLTAVTATIVGPRLTSPFRPQRTHGARFALVSMWIVGAIVTFIAGAELATNG